MPVSLLKRPREDGHMGGLIAAVETFGAWRRWGWILVEVGVGMSRGGGRLSGGGGMAIWVACSPL